MTQISDVKCEKQFLDARWNYKQKSKGKLSHFFQESGSFKEFLEWSSQNLTTFKYVVNTDELRKPVCFCQKATGSREISPESFDLEHKNYNLWTK